MPNWTLIGSSNVTSAVNEILFNSISGTYNDLVLFVSSVFMDNTASPNNMSFYVQVNGVTSGGLYGARILRYTNASGVGGGSSGSQNTGEITWAGDSISQTYGSSWVLHINEYANTNFRKQITGGGGNALQGNGAEGVTGWLYNANTAISSIRFYPQRGNFTTGTQLHLYGIKAAV